MAMNEKLVVPIPLTIADPRYVVHPENMLNERLGRVSMLSSVVVDLNAAIEVDTIALLATDAPSDQTYAYYAFDNLDDAYNRRVENAVFSIGGSLWASAEAGRRLHRQSIAMFPPVTARWWLIAVSGSFQIGRLIVGRSFTAEDTADIGYSYKVVDLGQQRRSSGGLDDPTIRGKVLEYSWRWSWMSEGEARGALLDLLAHAGITRDLLLILNPDAPDLHNVIGYGKLVEEVEVINAAGGVNMRPEEGEQMTNAYEASFRLQSRLILNL